jgi:ankyrin repeat protein
MIDYSSALHVAAENHELEAIKALLDDGRCNANARNYYIRTPCHVAAMVGDFEIVELLAKHSQALADLTLKDYESKTCWELARIHGIPRMILQHNCQHCCRLSRLC